jgi:hypothetical protein
MSEPDLSPPPGGFQVPAPPPAAASLAEDELERVTEPVIRDQPPAPAEPAAVPLPAAWPAPPDPPKPPQKPLPAKPLAKSRSTQPRPVKWAPRVKKSPKSARRDRQARVVVPHPDSPARLPRRAFPRSRALIEVGPLRIHRADLIAMLIGVIIFLIVIAVHT